MDQLETTIARLTVPQVSEALKNLRITLEETVGEIDDQQVREIVGAAEASGATELRGEILADANSPAEIDRWGRSLLRFLAADPELREPVAEAIDDAVHSSAKDFGLSALIVLGAVLVLLKWRPKKLELRKGTVKMEWEDNDVSVVSDLASAVSGVAAKPPTKKS